MKRQRLLGILVLGTMVACGAPAAQEGASGGAGKAEAWGNGDNPAIFDGDLEYRLDQLPKEGEAANIPWAANYWPTYEDNINHRWDGPDTDSPSAKYAKAFGLDVEDLEDTVSRQHGIDSVWWGSSCTQDSQCNEEFGEACARRSGEESGKCIPTWFGICHAWAPVAILEPEPVEPVTVNGVTFKVNDIKALLTLTYNSTSAVGVSLRCESGSKPGVEEHFDEYGRPVDDSCRDTNAGAWHVLVTNYLGIRKESFVEDRTRNFEVWNQPMRGYEITEQNEVTQVEANELIGVPQGESDYVFNDEAVRFVYISMVSYWIGESPSYVDGNLSANIDQYTSADYYEYVLELDTDGKIIGGEWVGNSKTTHPDFLWLPSSRRGSVAGGKITYEKVKDLLTQSERRQ